ncbi:hypothetical protein C1H46_038237 [Malus baccata]|uniref:Leucine-rich repeat-containing N-terminal plant-type domain-containing protein n=1 Tax=Malus baccata TaxID=106549 RepID=A0A540KPT1_MALBA|nr:hypothetical protein C1H46_038237 [Malus baccata]
MEAGASKFDLAKVLVDEKKLTAPSTSSPALLYTTEEFGDRSEHVTVDPSLVFENDQLRNAYIALQALKQAILSDPFNITGNWVGSNVCKYTGVFCTKAPTRTESKPIQVETEPAKADKTGWIKPQGALPLSLFGEEQEEDSGAGKSKVGILEQSHQVRLRRLLERRHGAALEPQIGLEVLGDLPHQPLEWQLADQELRALLVLPDLSQRHRSRPEAVRLLHSSGRRSRLPGCLGGQLLP